MPEIFPAEDVLGKPLGVGRLAEALSQELAQFSDLRCEQECCNTRFNHAPSYPGNSRSKWNSWPLSVAGWRERHAATSNRHPSFGKASNSRFDAWSHKRGIASQPAAAPQHNPRSSRPQNPSNNARKGTILASLPTVGQSLNPLRNAHRIAAENESGGMAAAERIHLEMVLSQRAARRLLQCPCACPMCASKESSHRESRTEPTVRSEDRRRTDAINGTATDPDMLIGLISTGLGRVARSPG